MKPVNFNRSLLTAALALTLVAGGAVAATASKETSQEGVAPATSQEMKPRPLAPSDYGQWESLGYGADLSPDGKWLAVPISRVDGTSELRVYSLETPGEPVVIKEGGRPEFSEDSLWLACLVGHSEDEAAELKEKSKPARNKLSLVSLATREVSEFENVAGFSFSGSGKYLAFRKYPASNGEKKGSAASNGDETPPESADVIVRLLADGTNMLFGSVSGFAWQDEGDLLGLTIESTDQAGNAVQLLNPATGHLRVLDSTSATYQGLAWREKSDDLAVFRSSKDEKREGPTQHVLAWRGLSGEPRPATLKPDEIPGFPEGMKVSTTPDLRWAEDGEAIFLGIQEWRQKPASEDEAKESQPESEETAGESPAGAEKSKKKEKVSDVQIWHANDERTIPMQEKNKSRDKARSFLSAWHLDDNRFVQLGTDLMARTGVVRGDRFITEADGKPYRFDNMFDRPRYDIYLVDAASGERKKVLSEVWDFEGSSATGRYLLYFQDAHYRVYEIEKGRHICLTCGIESSFVDEDYDTPVRKEDPPYGFAGWLEDDSAVLLYDKFDIWAVTPDGEESFNLTGGAANELVHRFLQLDREAKAIDPSKPLYVSQFGYWTKQSAFAALDISAGLSRPAKQAQSLSDKRLSRLIKAKDAGTLAFISEDFDDSSDYFVTEEGFGETKQVTATNPFQAEFTWGRSEVIDYKNAQGQRLQAALYYPAGFDPAKKYPMIVYVYERLSDGVHSYSAPSERRPYNETVFTSQGYFVLKPDITYRDRDPGLSALDCVTAAVNKALETGSIEASKVGLVGHSWGGYEASFIPTQTDLFAASIAGAPLTNFLSFYGTFHWGPGMPESQHFETGQARMDVPYWEDLDAYIRNSPVLSIDKLNTPMMLFFGDADSVVDWHQGVEMYNYARRAGKNLVMLVYPGEDHGARQKQNQIDYHRRVLQWFGHYLKGEEAPQFITEGVTALERERFLKENAPK